MPKFIDITGQKFGELTAIEYLGSSNWRCKCSCGKEKISKSYMLNNGDAKTCGDPIHKTVNLIGQTFGEWTVLDYAGNKKWLCKCSCGKEKEIYGSSLKAGESKSCGHNTGIIDMLNQVVGEWTVIKDVGHGDWLCQCSCGKIKIKKGRELRAGESKSCGHNTNEFKNLTGMQFDELKVIRYLGEFMWECECSCGKKKVYHRYQLICNSVHSCGCKKKEYSRKSLLDRYGDVAARANNPREEWQIEAMSSDDALKNLIIDQTQNDEKPTVNQLATLLDVTHSALLHKIHEFELENFINWFPNRSHQEDELYQFIKSIYDGNIERSNREIIKPRELDIYIPEKNIAIEFNGTYWHSEELRGKYAHQQKTIECAKQGIRLIHIFEYEWNNLEKREKICSFLKSILCDDKIKIFARDTHIKVIDNEKCREFENRVHIQNSAHSSIKLGCFYKDELLGVMTFGKPRFNNNYEYEIVRYCIDSRYIIVGGAEKLFQHFIRNYSPQSIITYTDISKFTGNVYIRLGFKPIEQNPITEPNYIWASHNSNKILTRYQTQKQLLVEMGLGEDTETEDEIMKKLNYIKIFNSGNLKLEWLKGD